MFYIFLIVLTYFLAVIHIVIDGDFKKQIKKKNQNVLLHKH